MVVTMKQVRNELEPDEPDYLKAAASLGIEALPHLEEIVKSGDVLLASKAAYLASLIPDEKSIAVLKTASESNFPEVRAAAAFGSRNIAQERAKDVLEKLKSDQDPGVRKQALRSIDSLQ